MTPIQSGGSKRRALLLVEGLRERPCERGQCAAPVAHAILFMSRSFADSLDGTLADDNRVLLNDSGLDRIRAQLRSIYGAMEQRGIEAGGPLALRLFS